MTTRRAVLTGYTRSMRRRNLPPVFAVIEKPFEHQRFLQTVSQCVTRSSS